jgi:hypothetical protein
VIANSDFCIFAKTRANFCEHFPENFRKSFCYFCIFSFDYFCKNENKFSRKCKNQNVCFNPSWGPWGSNSYSTFSSYILRCIYKTYTHEAYTHETYPHEAYTHETYTHKTYTHAMYTVTKRILYKTYTHKTYTGTRGFSVSAVPDILSSVQLLVKAVVYCCRVI